MSLVTTGGGLEADGEIELLVYGVDDPDDSVMLQLTKLLQKRLLLIAVEILSSVLTKNPRFYWKRADIDFVRSFETVWKSLESEARADCTNRTQIYEFPSGAYDPGMILLYFRQNLCGSTFFHPLASSEWKLGEVIEETSAPGANLRIDPSHLLFYYNNSPSKLDPKFQSESTLTKRGAEFSRQAGSGIAIIRVSLVDAKGREIREFCVAEPPGEVESTLDASTEALRFNEMSEFSGKEDPSQVFVRVEVTDTALKRDILHQWILLSLNQVLIAWRVERHLERKQRGLLRDVSPDLDGPCNTDHLKRVATEKISHGLPYLEGILESSLGLPHPAVLKVENVGVVRSSAVATFTLDLLEKVILAQLQSETNSSLTFEDGSEFCVIRSSRSTKPRQVCLQWDSSKRKAVVYGAERTVIKDAPIDCPEYTIFFYSRNENGPSFPMLFQEVAVGGEVEQTGEELLEEFKDRHRDSFCRSFAFVFWVKRNRRLLLAYNWSSRLFKNTAALLKEKDMLFLLSTENSVSSLQQRCLGNLASLSGTAKEKRPKADASRRGSTKQGNKRSTISDSSAPSSSPEKLPNSTRRIARPTSIRRPRLIGKSVEGAAMHAVAASRARASAIRFKASTPPKASKKTSDEVKSGRVKASKRAMDVSASPLTQESLKEETEEEIELARARKQFASAAAKKETLQRQYSLRVAAHLSLTSLHWPLKPDQSIWPQVADFIVSRSSLAWMDVSYMLPFPPKLLGSFLRSFTRAWTQHLGLRLIHFQNSNSSSDSVLLMGLVRNLRSRKCFVVVKLSMTRSTLNGEAKTLISSEGRVLTLPRRWKTKGMRSTFNSSSLMEKDSAGTDKLSTELHASVNLEGLIFDHAASTVERSVKSVDGDLNRKEAFRFARRLIARYPIRRMMKLRSSYKCYEATIVLKSYGDKLIDKYDGPTLFGWLLSHAKERDLLHCGPGGLCFKQEIVARGTQSMCFLACDNVSDDKMVLVVVCRTNGRDIHEWMFREGSDVAISILDNIAVEFAGLAFAELHSAATSLHRHALWRLLSHIAPARSPTVPPREQIKELLSLCSVAPVSHYYDHSRFAAVHKDAALINFERCCACMTKDPAFSPSWVLHDEEDSQIMFYLASEDLFLLLKAGNDGIGLQINIVECNESPSVDEKTTRAIHKVANFLLHFLWTELVA
jgi:hypothetical protein